MSYKQVSEKIQCTFEHVLSQKTTCYQFDDGTFFLFKNEPPYELSAVVNGRKIEARMPSIKDPLICTGIHGDSLYFYSSPPRRLTYRFYRAMVDKEKGIAQFDKINEIRTDSFTLKFALQQPFYVSNNQRDRLFGFGESREEPGKLIPSISEDAVFFQHVNTFFYLSPSEQIVIKENPFYKWGKDGFWKAIEVPEPEKTAILSCWKTRFLYLVSGCQLLVFFENQHVKQFELVPAPSYLKERLTAPSLFIAGLFDKILILQASDGSENEIWSHSIPEYCNSSNAYRIFADYGYEEQGASGDMKTNRANLAILMKQKVPTFTGKIVKGRPAGEKTEQSPAIPAEDEDTLRDFAPMKALLDVVEIVQLYEENKEPTFESEFLSKYKPIRVLGKGAFGCVFEAQFKLIGTRYAIKRIALSENGEPKALNEVVALDAFNHPGIVRYNDAWIERPPEGWQKLRDRQLFKDLEYKEILCESTLSNWLNDNKDRDLSRMKSWFRQIVSAVGYIHEEKKIHRDLKPSNILFASADHLKICDFGIITDCAIEESHEKPKTRTFAQGSAMYMAPEQFWSGYTSKVDIFALGLILAQLCVALTVQQAAEIFDKYRAGKTNKVLDGLPEVNKFVAWLTNVKDIKRPTCPQILQHAFLS